MEFIFKLTPYDENWEEKISYIFEKRVEAESRLKCKTLWKITDKLNSIEKISDEKKEKRRKREIFFSWPLYFVGFLFLVPSLAKPEGLYPVMTASAVAFGTGMGTLYKHKVRFLGIINFLLGLILVVGALGNSSELGNLLYQGIFCVVSGIWYMLRRKALIEKKKKKDFLTKKQREEVIKEGIETFKSRNEVLYENNFQVKFKDEEIIFVKDKEEAKINYEKLRYMIETKDLFLILFKAEEKMEDALILKKEDLEQDFSDFREFMEEKGVYFNFS